MTKHNTNAKRPPTDATLTDAEYRDALRDAGLTPEGVWTGEHGVTVRGPYHRTKTDADGMVVRVRRYYRLSFEAVPGSKERSFAERKTKPQALAWAREVDDTIGQGLKPHQGEKRFQSVATLIDAYLDPSNHVDQWHSPRSKEAPRSFLDNWARPIIGQLRCIEWDPAASRSILEQMEKSGLRSSYRSQGYTYLSALATFARTTTHGFLPRSADPLEDIARPGGKESRFVDVLTLPTVAQVAALGDNLGEVVARKWLAKVKAPSPARLERAEFERFRWSMVPRIVFGAGLRPGEALALRTGDFDLRDRTSGLGIDVERQTVRGSSTRTCDPKHGSKRRTYLADDAWDDVVKLVRWVEAVSGPNALLWSRMRDHTKMLDDSTLYSAYFVPAATATAGFTFEDVPQWTVAEETTIGDDGTKTQVLMTVPLKKNGVQVTRRVWNWSWRHLRHLYGTTALAAVSNGGWGQDIADVSIWMGHRSAETTWEYYVGKRPGGGARMAAATGGGTSPGGSATVAEPADTPVAQSGTRGHLRIVN